MESAAKKNWATSIDNYSFRRSLKIEQQDSRPLFLSGSMKIPEKEHGKRTRFKVVWEATGIDLNSHFLTLTHHLVTIDSSLQSNRFVN